MRGLRLLPLAAVLLTALACRDSTSPSNGAGHVSKPAEGLVEGTWENVAPIPRWYGGAYAGVLNGKILIASGGTMDAYDPITNSWSARAPLPIPNVGGASAAIGGKLYAAGGCGSDGDCRIHTNSAFQIYDDLSNSWSIGPPMPTARGVLAGAAVGGKFYAIGGTPACPPCDAPGTVEMYDPVTNSWFTKASLTVGRNSIAVATLDGVLYAIGGVNGSGVTAVVEAYDPLTNTWTSRASMPTPRAAAAAAIVNGRIYVMGGYTSTWVATVESYDPATNSWRPEPAMRIARWFLSGAAVDGVLYAIGGSDAVRSYNVNEALLIATTPPLDVTPPVATISSATDGNAATLANGQSTRSTGITIAFAGSDAVGVVGFQCTLDAGAPVACTSPASYSGLASGTHTLRVTASDAAANTSAPASFAWTIDVTPPVATINSAIDGNLELMASGETTLSTDIAFTFDGTDAVGVVGFQCSLDSAPLVSCSSPRAFAGLALGVHAFQVIALDAAGNVSIAARFTWTVVTPSQAILQMIDMVNLLGLPNGVATSLNASLKNINTSNVPAAIAKLNTFITKVSSHEEKGELTAAAADELKQAANAIIAKLQGLY